jgi:hypothetical protein
MKIRYFLILILFITIISCKKDGGSGLGIKIKSVSSNFVPVNGSLQFVLDFTDNGRNSIDTIYIKKIRINQDSELVDTSQLLINEFRVSAPSYPGATKGQLQLDLDYNSYLPYEITPPTYGNPPQDENDSLIFKFAIQDKANNRSDTVTSGLVIIERQN